MARFGWIAVAVLAFAVPMPLTAQSGGPARPGPSFSCAQAKAPVETTICATPALAAADRTMAALYAIDQVSAFGNGPSNELAAQRKAIDTIRHCATPPARQTIVQCLQARYDDRLGDLAIAAVMRAPDMALPVLRRTDPAFAPIVEAVQIWALEPVGADWSSPQRAARRMRILALLRPAMTDLLTKQDQSYGREILADSANGKIVVKRVEDVLISERHLAAFLNVLGPYLDDDGPHGARDLPCAAIVRHPALLAATGSVFGSTMDSFVLHNDCAETLPPTPALMSIVERLYKTWPTCDGTIRFAAYRAFETSVDAARLGVSPRGGRIGDRRGVAAADIPAAHREMAAYYARYLGKSPAVADAMATAAMGDVLDAAHSCGD